VFFIFISVNESNPSVPVEFVGQDSSVRIATRYGMDGPGIESWWGEDFSHTSRPALWPTHPPIQWVTALSRGGGGSGRDVALTTHTHLAPRLKKK
jgi:hypothetical protein